MEKDFLCTNEIQQENTELKKAKNLLVYYLGRKPYSLYELEEKLKKKQFSQAVITDALNYVVEHQWADDKKAAEAVVRYRTEYSVRSRWFVEKELQKRRIAAHIIEVVLAESYPPQLEEEIFAGILQKEVALLPGDWQQDQKQVAKLCRKVANKGFSQRWWHLIFSYQSSMEDDC